MFVVASRRSAQWTALAAGATLALALAGCSAPAADTGAAGDQGSDAGSADDQGTVTVTFASGEHQGEHSGSGTLKCGHGDFVPDGWWIVFSADFTDSQPEDPTLVNIWHAPADQVDNPESPYPGEQFLANLGLGNIFDGTGAKYDVGGDDGGSLRVDGAEGNSVSFSGETSDNVAFTVVADCSVITTE